MAEVHNPHDLFVKHMLSQPELAREFLSCMLPTETAAALDLTTLELTSASHVDPELREQFSDLVFNVQQRSTAAAPARVYVLIEHKSYPDAQAPLQLLRAMVGLWDAERRTPQRKLSPIIPLVLYHGAGVWPTPGDFASLIAACPTALRHWLPTVPHHLVNLQDVPTESLQASLVLRGVLRLFQAVFADDLTEQATSALHWVYISNAPDRLEIIFTMVKYLSNATDLTEDQIKQTLECIDVREKGTIMPTLASKWMQQGIEQGIEQGELQGKREILSRLFRRRFQPLPPAVEARLADLTSDQLDLLGSDVFDLSSIDDLLAWLQRHAPMVS